MTPMSSFCRFLDFTGHMLRNQEQICVCVWVGGVEICFNCTVSSLSLLFLEYITLFLSPALEQHQYTYWSLSKMASGEKPSYCHSLVWSIVCDCGRSGSIF